MSSSSSTPPNSQCLKVTNNVSFELSKKNFLMSRKAKKLVEFCLHFSKVVQISLQFDIFFLQKPVSIISHQQWRLKILLWHFYLKIKAKALVLCSSKNPHQKGDTFIKDKTNTAFAQ